MKTILFRFDYGSKIGYGHHTRCTVLAKKFIKKGYKCILVTKKNKIDKKTKKVFHKTVNLNNKYFVKEENQIIKIYKEFNCKYLVIDLIKFNIKSQKKLKKNKINWLQFINNLKVKCIANQLVCSIPYSTKDKKIINKESKQKVYIGKNYSIIRDQFLKKKKIKSLKKIFICFGGGDDRGSILFILKSIISNIEDYKINLLIGDNPRINNIKEWINNKNLGKKIKILRNKKYIVNYIDESHFAICSGGTVTHEINSRGKKMIILSIAKNQEHQGKKWENFNNYYLGILKKSKIHNINHKLENFFRLIKQTKFAKFKRRDNKFLDIMIKNAINN